MLSLHCELRLNLWVLLNCDRPAGGDWDLARHSHLPEAASEFCSAALSGDAPDRAEGSELVCSTGESPLLLSKGAGAKGSWRDA